MNRRCRFFPFVALRLLLALGLLVAQAPARAEEISEYSIKAVLFYRLSQFVYWPGQDRALAAPVLCVAGVNPFGTALVRAVQGSHAELRFSALDPAPCNLLFIPRSEAPALERWLQKIEGRRLVTVSDIPGFARAGGMIELPFENERVGIVINRQTARRHGFEFSAQLLRLARIVE